MKRKWILGAAAAVLVLCAGAGSVLASGSSGQTSTVPDTEIVSKVCTGPCGGNYADENGDGICDRCAAQQSTAGCQNGYTDADGDGVCDNYTDQTCTVPDTAIVSKVCTGPCGGNYADENGDGICDRCAAQQGTAGCQNGYTDADGDGVCDNYTGQTCTGGHHEHARHRAGCGQG